MSPYNYAAGNPIKFLDLNGDRPTDYEATSMMANAYNKEEHLSGEWKRSAAKFEQAKFENKANGFRAVLYEKDVKGKTEYCLIFAGTDPGLPKDWWTNFTHIVAYCSSALNARALCLNIKKQWTGLKEPPEMTLGAHSEGVVEMVWGSAASDWPGIGVNGLGFRPDQKAFMEHLNPKINSLIKNIVTIGEPVKDFNDFFHLKYIGDVTPLDPGYNFSDTFTWGDKLLSSVPGYGSYWSGKEFSNYKLDLHSVNKARDIIGSNINLNKKKESN